VAFLSQRFGARRSSIQRTTSERALRIDGPVVGFLNLDGSKHTLLSEADQRAIGLVFKEARVSKTVPPRCHVLFIYWTAGAPAPTSPVALRELIKAAGAYIAIFACENDSEAYIEHLGRRTDWGANIVMVLDRKGESFCLFLSQLFQKMFEGRSMLEAWTELAPQRPSIKTHDVPDAILAAEAGHITFSRST
jgi:hypothetical protein